MIKIHGGDLAVLTRAVEGLLDLVLGLPLLVLCQLLVILTHPIGLEELLDIDRSSFLGVQNAERLDTSSLTSAS